MSSVLLSKLPQHMYFVSHLIIVALVVIAFDLLAVLVWENWLLKQPVLLTSNVFVLLTNLL